MSIITILVFLASRINLAIKAYASKICPLKKTLCLVFTSLFSLSRIASTFSSVYSCFPNHPSKGKYAELEKENKRLLAENEEMKNQVAEMEEKGAMVPTVVEKKVTEKIVEINKRYEQEKEQLKIDSDKEYNNLIEKHNGVIGKYNELLQNFRA